LGTDLDNLEIIDVEVADVEKSNFIKRKFQESNYGKKVVQLLKQIQPDVVISANTPIDAQKRIVKFCNQEDISFIFWLQDIISIAAQSILKKKLGFIGSLIGRYYQMIEKKLLKRSDHIIAIAESFEETIMDWSVQKDKVTVIPNWAPIEEMPMLSKDNDFSQKQGINDKFTVLYSGTMGMKHNPNIIADAAEELKENSEVMFVVISEGDGIEHLKEKKNELGLDNLKLLPFQPFDQFPKVLASADCILTLLEKDAGEFSVPSKVWSSYCAGRPSLLVVPEENLTAKITESISAGIVIDNTGQESSKKLADTILKLEKSPQKRQLMGENARAYAEEHFYIESIAQKFENIIRDIV
jgi:glycosyltransferase involved in cell wall biosynthesis